MKAVKFLTYGALAMIVTACGNVDSSHLIFGQNHIVGLEIAGPSPEQTGGALTLAYKDRNVAIVPVAVKNSDGTYSLLGGTNKKSDSEDINDAYSTLGQFELNAGTDGKPSVGLGKFFATGIAAQTLAEGFKEKLKK